MLVTLTINPFVTNGLSHPYQFGESTFVYRSIRTDFSFLFHFSMKNMCANIIAPDGKPHFAASHLGLLFLPMSHKKDARLIWVNTLSFTFDVIFLRILKLVFTCYQTS